MDIGKSGDEIGKSGNKIGEERKMFLQCVVRKFVPEWCQNL